MEASELRIGNYVLVNGMVKPITSVWYHIPNNTNANPSIGASVPKKGDSDKCIKLHEIKPIPLTEEWLIKFGFEVITKQMLNLSYHYWQYKDILQVFLISNQSEFEVQLKAGSEWFNFYKQYKHVHQLQNLYFALTGEELTIK